uniref:Uncharacterized protein n=1 Tax=Rhizophora mucronata TaxID=61149 RepID=A0A2P2IKX4_RHIMU
MINTWHLRICWWMHFQMMLCCEAIVHSKGSKYG